MWFCFHFEKLHLGTGQTNKLTLNLIRRLVLCATNKNTQQSLDKIIKLFDVYLKENNRS